MTDLASLPLYIGAFAVGAVACVTDIRMRRIPNVVTLGGAGIGIVSRVWTLGLVEGGWGATGWLTGLLLLVPLFLLRGMGGGDVKLLAAFGAWLGPRLVLWVGLYGVIAGGILALVVALASGVMGRTVANISLLLTHWRVAGVGPVDGLTLETANGPKLPYAIPLTCGLMVAIWLKG